MGLGQTVRMLFPREELSPSDKFLELMKDPFRAQLATTSIKAALITSVGTSGVIFLLFCILRPFNTIVYAPKLRHADEKHAPPPLGKGLFAWWKPVYGSREEVLMEKIGLDAVIFLRFTRMCRNIFLVLAALALAIVVPISVVINKEFYKQFGGNDAIFMMTPQGLFGKPFWAYVAVAYIFDAVVCSFLWWNYRAVHKLRRKYMDSPDYQNSLHSRTLMITDIPRSLRSDQGIVQVADELRTTPEIPRASIGRNVKDIPDLIEEHEAAVIALEKVLAKYLKNPNKLPNQRPLCRPSKKDPGYPNKKEKVDAINYLTARIEALETQIREVRETVDKRDAMPYGFASYETIESAHSVAFAGKRKHPQGTTVRLATRPNDLIWKNLHLDPKTRRWRRFINNLWIILLTLAWTVPNALIAVFLAQLKNLGFLWPAFQKQLEKNPTSWSVVQGVLAPAVTSAFYFFLPILFRRLSIQAGDTTKTSRERHVIHQLYSFFVFNNLFVFSLFAAVWTFITAVVKATSEEHKSFATAVQDYGPFDKTMIALCTVSPFWITWLLQRNLGAAIDLAQVVNLGWGSFSRKFLNPTPRELIQRTAPPPFDYASYYNYFLYYSTVALCFAAIQPITLVVCAFYFLLDTFMKKYLLMYVFCTKTESGGLYWRVIFNRFLVGTFLSNCVIALMVAGRGYAFRWNMLASMVPLPILLIAFKFYCKRTFDDSIRYYTTVSAKGSEAAMPIDKERRRDRVGVRFGHPALYQKLTVPMVHEKSKHLLAELYRGRLDADTGYTNAGFSDMYAMKRMSKEKPGKTAGATGPFEFVSDSNMDFENYKNRPEFAEGHGGDGNLFSRPGTPVSTLASVRGRSESRDSERAYEADGAGVTYPAGYHTTPSALREMSPSPERGLGKVESNSDEVRDESALLRSAAPMGSGVHIASQPYGPWI
ncbi:DUF221-domain-containing protein [Delitschia confertaspora ATCC 74209]|uniref:DUF221-domain-containing protein n=1 Tax=Delitschia confertaspora ATCC 74209 TaxID=1513339 RepID=A0A9P4JQ73_9PLEO|nr:DUF221-domain-containing protein [Delitschia confertaspora ATCC 74209]